MRMQIPPFDPDGWKRNFNSTLLIGNTIMVVVAVFVALFSGVSRYNKVTSQQEINTASISSLTTQMTVLSLNMGQVQSAISALENWRTSHEATSQDVRQDFEGDLNLVRSRVEAVDADLAITDVTVARLSDRAIATDAKLTENLQNLRELQKAIQETSIDIEVIRAWVDGEKKNDLKASGAR